MSTTTRKRLWECRDLYSRENLVSVVSESIVSLVEKVAPNNSQTIQHSDTDSLFCTSCQVNIADTSHYKTDWHRINTRLKSAGVPPVMLEEFETLALDESSSDEESDLPSTENTFIEQKVSQTLQPASNPLDVHASTGSARISFITKDNKILQFWKAALLHGKSNTIGQYANSLLQLAQPNPFPAVVASSSAAQASKSGIEPVTQFPFKWTIFLCQGGFFAGAVFDHDKVLKHKRIARYTVRRKQGGAQATKDSSKGGIHSGGASIRRYNETRLREEIAELMNEWKLDLAQSSRVFVHAPSYNSASFFFEGSPLSKRDARVRHVPIVTQRPSFVELQRIHSIMSTVEIGDFEDLKAILNQSGHLNRSGHVDQSGHQEVSSTPSDSTSLASSVDTITSLNDGDHWNDVFDPQRAQSSQQGNSKDKVEDILAKSIVANDMNTVMQLIVEEDFITPVPANPDDLIWPLSLAVQLKNTEMVKCLIEYGEPLDGRSPQLKMKTALHLACETGQDALVELLLEEGANLGVTDLYNQRPYNLCKEKSTRNVLRRFAGENPDLWDYSECQIPPLTDDMEAQAKIKDAEKRKKKKAAQKERKKQQKVEEAEMKEVEAERTRINDEDKLAREAALERTKKILNMTEREKRALAAEGRINPASVCCDNCGKAITTTPFEKWSLKYCTTTCVVEHKRILDAIQPTSSNSK